MVNAALIAVVGIAFLIGNYFLYGRYIEKKIKPTSKKTPAVLHKGKIDYYPSNKFFLFGHHFASIAGAGPIIGPILAVSYFGWALTSLWIILGTVFIGAVHDYLALMISVRNKAKGISKITEKSLNSRAGKIFALMIWITLTMIIATFSVSAADSIINQPMLVIPVLAISVIAFVLGIAVYKFKANPWISSVVALVIAFFFMYVGYLFPVVLPFSASASKFFWVTILIVYGGAASLIPVWMFLQPRDYLSSIQLVLFLLLGLVSLLIVRPVMNAPAYISGNFPLWPILFITVACGAVSGFHSLVASGTTSKQLAKERHGRFVGYGGMVAEGILALLVVLFIASLDWNTGPLNFLGSLDKGWVVAFGNGFGNIVSKLGFLSFGLASLIGAFLVNQFILTSLDTSSRISRMLITENIKHKICQNKLVAVVIAIVPAYVLAVTNAYADLWRMFGTSNQLIAAIGLITISAYFVQKKRSVKFLMIPTVFMMLTTISALVYSLFNKAGFIAEGNWVLSVFAGALVVLALIVSWEGFVSIKRKT